MIDDELRAACEAWLAANQITRKQGAECYVFLLNGLMAFATRQQAVGLREAGVFARLDTCSRCLHEACSARRTAARLIEAAATLRGRAIYDGVCIANTGKGCSNKARAHEKT